VVGDSRCSEAGLEVCRGDGSGWDATSCELGCDDEAEPHCLIWEPSNVPVEALERGAAPFGPAMAAWRSDASYVSIDTDSGAITAMVGRDEIRLREAGEGLDEASGIFLEHIDQADGAPSLAVFSVTEATFPSDLTVWVMGGHAFVLASAGEVVVSGTLNCRAYGYDGRREQYPGPGGSGRAAGQGTGSQGREGSGSSDGGGGGGSFGGVGGSSGPGDFGGRGGASYGTPELIPLRGGSGGGDGADSPGEGGPGGGACQLLSATSVVVSGIIDAGGAGGRGGLARGGGGGGGSGGALLLEAPTVRIEGVLATNGGAGGSGAASAISGGNDGDRCNPGVDPALGGVGPSDWFGSELGCDGGQGSSAELIDGGDTVCDDNDDDGGGGGGGSGRIRLNGLEVDHGAGTLSPSPATTSFSVGTLVLR
jgi:hypothetical protein